MTNKNKINIQMSWDKEVIPAKTESKRSLLIELTANSDLSSKKKARRPVNLALVIDRSGSMRGSPIAAAKSAVMQIADQLNSKDRLSLVSFDNEVETHFSNVKMDNKGSDYVKSLVSEIYARATTDLSGGWFAGAKCATEAIDEGSFKNGFVIVLSDGLANEGIQDPRELNIHASELASRGIQTSSIGIGAHYSPLQLDALAEGGRGRLHDTETAEDIIDVVLGELGEIGNTIAHNIKLNIHHPSSVELKCLSKMKAIKSGNFYQISIGNLQLNQTKSIAFLASIGKYIKDSNLPFESHITWDEVETGEENESSVFNSTLNVVSIAEEKRTEINTAVVQKVADLWEASMAYESLILNEQNQFDDASNLYANNSMKFSLIVDSLEDSDIRKDRFNSMQKKVAKQWQGRSKRSSYNFVKKMSMSEPDLRKRDAGSWNDEF